MLARYQVHKLIQDAYRCTALRDRLVGDRRQLAEEYGLTDGETDLLVDGSFPALTDMGVHPNLQMKFYEMTTGNFGSIAKYLEDV